MSDIEKSTLIVFGCIAWTSLCVLCIYLAKWLAERKPKGVRADDNFYEGDKICFACGNRKRLGSCFCPRCGKGFDRNQVSREVALTNSGNPKVHRGYWFFDSDAP